MPGFSPGNGFQTRFDALSDWRGIPSRLLGTRHATSFADRGPKTKAPFGESRGFLGQRGLRSALFGATRDAKPWAKPAALRGSWGIPKTIEYFAASNLTGVATDTTLGAATVYSTTIDCPIVETIERTKSFLSVKLIWSFAGGWTVNNGVTGTRVTAKLGSNTAISLDRSHITTQVNGRPLYYEIETDITDVFRDQYKNGVGSDTVVTATIAASSTLAATITGHTCKVVITYAFDLARQAQQTGGPAGDILGYYYMKTIRIPVQSHLSGLTTSQQESGADGTLGKSTQMPDLSTFLPEANVHIYSCYLESRACVADSAITDFTPFIKVGAPAEVARATLLRGNWVGSTCLWRDHYDVSAFTAAATTIQWRCDVTARLSQIGGFIVVTYSYDASTSFTVLCEGHWPIVTSVGSNEGGTGQVIAGNPVMTMFRMGAVADIPEPNPTIVQSAVVINHESTGNSSSLGLRAGSQPGLRAPYTTINVGGTCPIVQRAEDGWSLTQGENYLSLDFVNDALLNTTRGKLVDGYAHVLYTTDLTAENYDAPVGTGWSHITMEGMGGGTGQLHPEKCTRVVGFNQHTIETEALVGTQLDTANKMPPRPAMLGNFWKLTGAYLEASVLCANNSQQYQYAWEQLSNEFGDSGVQYFPNVDNVGAMSTFESMTKRLSIGPYLQVESEHPYLANPERGRRQLWIATSGGSTWSSWSWWLTVQNHQFLITGSVRENSAFISPGSDVDIWASYPSPTPLDNTVKVKQIAKTKLQDTFAAKNYFLTYAHESYRDVWASSNATTYPSAGVAATPGNGNDFAVQTFTGVPGEIMVSTNTAQIHQRVSIAAQSFATGLPPPAISVASHTAQIRSAVNLYPQSFAGGLVAAGGGGDNLEVLTFPAVSTTATSATFTFTGTSAAESSLDGAAFAPATSPINLVGLSVASHTLVVRLVSAPTVKQSFTWDVVSASGDTTPPIITIVSPAPGTSLLRFTPLVLRVTDNVALRRVFIFMRFADSEVWETVHDGDNFSPTFPTPDNTRTVITGPNGYEFNLLRLGGWPETPELHVIAIDAAGNMTVL